MSDMPKRILQAARGIILVARETTKKIQIQWDTDVVGDTAACMEDGNKRRSRSRKDTSKKRKSSEETRCPEEKAHVDWERVKDSCRDDSSAQKKEPTRTKKEEAPKRHLGRPLKRLRMHL